MLREDQILLLLLLLLLFILILLYYYSRRRHVLREDQGHAQRDLDREAEARPGDAPPAVARRGRKDVALLGRKGGRT